MRWSRSGWWHPTISVETEQLAEPDPKRHAAREQEQEINGAHVIGSTLGSEEADQHRPYKDGNSASGRGIHLWLLILRWRCGAAVGAGGLESS